MQSELKSGRKAVAILFLVVTSIIASGVIIEMHYPALLEPTESVLTRWVVTIGMTGAVFIIGAAALNLKRENPKRYGIFELIVGAATALWYAHAYPADPTRLASLLGLVTATYIVVRGLENYTKKPEVGCSVKIGTD